VRVRRLLNFLGFALCAALLGYALYAQFQLGIEPFPRKREKLLIYRSLRFRHLLIYLN